MKLYVVSSPEYTFADGEVVNAGKTYAGTQADARHARMAYEVPFKDIKPNVRPKVTVEEVDVPTNKEALLNWLNENAV